MSAKPASPTTSSLNREVLDLLDFGDQEDFENASRGFIADLEDRKIMNDMGGVAFDMDRYNFTKGEAPDTVNPSLWRQAKVNCISGLFTIHPRIHQVRGTDLSNMTLIEGDSGWIVIDPLISKETARASLELANKHLGERPVVAVIYTHTHIDHFGGVCGVVDRADVDSGKIPILAPDGFMDFCISEAVLAGNAMNRRAQYMYGMRLEPGERGFVCCGLGKIPSTGTITLIPPTDIISKTGETRLVDGVEIEFQMANGSEAPAEFMFYFPQFLALCASEVTSHNMHNILTPRGAQVRNALDWSKYIEETIELFMDRTDLLFASHHWPTWGVENILPFMERQRDLYRFTHDETLRLANHGHTIHEIPDLLEVPESLSRDFACRGYYGTMSYNIKAVYQFYLGWWDSNPSTIEPLPPVEASKRLVKAMGGAQNVMDEGKRAYDAGDYRWGAEIMNKLVFAEPENADARDLLADILEQMGYQAESGPRRNTFLAGADELRNGVSDTATPNSSGPDMIAAMGIEMALDFMGVKFNPEKAGDASITVRLDFTDTGETWQLQMVNGVLHNSKRPLPKSDVGLRMNEASFYALLGQIKPLQELVGEGAIAIEGDISALAQLFGMLDEFDPNFAIVTP